MSCSSITKVMARQVLDSRGNPTLEAEVHLQDGSRGRAIVPSGASTGEHEALELRDGDKEQVRRQGRAQGGRERQHEDRPGTDRARRDSSRSSSTRRCSRSTAPDEKVARRERDPGRLAWPAAHAAAASVGLPLYRYLGGTNAKTLPVPLANVLNGGAHSDAPIDFQEYMIVPKGAPTFREAIRYGAEVYHSLKKVLHDEKLGTGGGDEGGFAPRFKSNEHALEVLALAVKNAGYKLRLGHFLRARCRQQRVLRQGHEQVRLQEIRRQQQDGGGTDRRLPGPAKRYPIISIEDGTAENDWAGWKKLTDAMGKTTQLVGDDLFVTNVEFLQKGIDQGVGNSILVKVNQIGSLTETFDAVELAKRAGYTSDPQPPLGRERGHDHRRHRGGAERRPDQDRFFLAQRPPGEV